MRLIYIVFLVQYLVNAALESKLIQPACDVDAARNCEYEFLQCRLFTGPADDPVTMCNCGESFYGDCLRRIGCERHMQVGASVTPSNYMKQCVDLIRQFDCPSTLMCAINCATEGSVDKANALVMPFNNYGRYYLRVRFCTAITHPEKLERYSVIDQVPCKTLDDFFVCSRWIPPMTFVPLAFVKNTTYMEVDSCDIIDGIQSCRTVDPKPYRIYGNKFMFPKSYDVDQIASSVCQSDNDCLGSFCDVKFHPSMCSPKAMVHVEKTGRFYFSDPFG